MPIDIDGIFDILRIETKKYQVPVVDLISVQTGSVFKVLVATILSARTNDKTTAEASSRLFNKVSTLEDLSKLSEKEIEEIIFPVGFYKNKAKYLKDLPGEVYRLYGGVIPDTIDELVKLPGVGRKTANLVLVQGFNKPAICVDVHVHRIMNRLGYIRTKNPLETEFRLRKKLSKKYWIEVNTFFVMLGQYICRPISPKCTECPISEKCRKLIK